MYGPLPEEIVSLVHNVYCSTNFRPQHGKFAILASLLLSNTFGELKVISLGSGSKCLAEIRLQKGGVALHDSHAEVLARRGAIRWFMEEIKKTLSGQTSSWIKEGPEKKYMLIEGVKLHMYISTVPCGDASTRYLAACQDEEMAALKDSTAFPELPPGVASRGRDNYSLYGVLRTKPGRADSPRAASMSCSDKIASWNLLGIQGALLTHLMCPVYLSSITIGEVEPSMHQIVTEDCQRAFWRRLHSLDAVKLPQGYHLRKPSVHFTSIPFIHSKTSLGAISSSNDSLCWIADSPRSHEVLINGLRRGVPPKHRDNIKFRPLLSKIALYNLFVEVSKEDISNSAATLLIYRNSKQTAFEYQATKTVLRGSGGPFVGWVLSGSHLEQFDLDGNSVDDLNIVVHKT